MMGHPALIRELGAAVAYPLRYPPRDPHIHATRTHSRPSQPPHPHPTPPTPGQGVLKAIEEHK